MIITAYKCIIWINSTTWENVQRLIIRKVNSFLDQPTPQGKCYSNRDHLPKYHLYSSLNPLCKRYFSVAFIHLWKINIATRSSTSKSKNNGFYLFSDEIREAQPVKEWESIITVTTDPSNQAIEKHQKEVPKKGAFYMQKETYNKITVN